jgi:hypothetical protein
MQADNTSPPKMGVDDDDKTRASAPVNTDDDSGVLEPGPAHPRPGGGGHGHTYTGHPAG